MAKNHIISLIVVFHWVMNFNYNVMFIYILLTICILGFTMDELPPKILATFEKLKKEYPFRIVLKRINDKYYIYKERGVWLKDTHKTKIISEYLGRMTSDGLYIKKKFTAKDDLENAKALIAERGGEIIWHEKPSDERLPLVRQDLTATEIDLKLLTALSMNARLSATKMAKIVGISEQAVYGRIKAIEKKLGLKYILELDIDKLGYTRYLVLVKFEETVPGINDLEKTFVNEPSIQFVATSKGEYDLIIYMIGSEDITTTDNFRRLLLKTELSKYGARWNLMPIAQTYSFMPVRDIFIENVLKNKEWKRTKTNPTPKQEELMHRELLLLKELNSNSTRNFLEIDKENNLHDGTARYAYNTLKTEGIIVRPTVTATNTSIKYIGMIIISNIYEKKVEENRHKFLFDIVEYGQILNRYSLVGNIGMPDGAILFLPVMNEGDLDKAAKRIEKELQGSIVSGSVITNIIVGSLCYRRFDNDYSRQHELLIEFGKLEPKAPSNYE